MKNLLISLFAVFAATAAIADVPAIKPQSVAIRQDSDRLVTVDYELTGLSAVVTVDFFTNGVSIGEANFANVAGDVNRVVDPGRRRILWRADRGWPGHSSDSKFTAAVKAWTLDNPPDIFVIDLMSRLPGRKSWRFYTSESALPDGGLANKKRYAGECIVFKRIFAAGRTFRLGCPPYQAGMSVSGFNPSASPSYHATFTADYYLGIYPMTIAQSKLFWTHNPMPEHSEDQSRWNGPDTQQTPCVRFSYRDMRGEGKGFNWPTNAVVDGRTVDAAEVDDDFPWGNTKRRTCISQLREISGLKRIDLPTRAQWEYAARAGCPFNFYQLPGDVAYDDLSGYKVAGSREKAFAERVGWTDATAILDGNRGFRTVGLKEPNAWGIYDLIGNCSELVLDRYGDVPYAGKTQTDPRGAEAGDDAVKIGNYCVSTPNSCCLWNVGASPRTTRDTTMGVRFCVPVDLLK